MHANRRDFIFPNYCDTGFWAFLRSRYGADYIVADAKNYSQNVSRKDILQMSNYLKAHGAGLETRSPLTHNCMTRIIPLAE